MRRSGTGLGFLVLALSAALASPATAQGKKVRFGYGVTVVDASAAPWMTAAKTGGFWQEEGLDVQVSGFNGAGPALQLLANGQVDVVLTGIPEMMQLRGEGARIKVIANVYDHNHIFPAVAIDSPITTIEQFRGKTIGVPAAASTPVIMIEPLMRAHGMTKADATVIPVGTGATAFHALQTKQIDVLWEWVGQYAVIETQFGAKFRKFDNEPSLDGLSFVVGVFTREETIRNDPEMLTGLLRGMAKGIALSRTNPDAVARGHFQQFPGALSTSIPLEDAVKQASQIVSTNVQLAAGSTEARRWGYAAPDRVEHMRDLLMGAGMIKTKLPWTDYYTPDFVKPANDFDPAAVAAKAKAMK